MSVKTCLLVTDDPDDHQTFSEAFADVSSEAIVLNLLDSSRALELIKSKKHIPDYFIVDLSMHGIRINTFLKMVRNDPGISVIPMVLYGLESDINKVEEPGGLLFFNKQYRYSELRNFLRAFIDSQRRR